MQDVHALQPTQAVRQGGGAGVCGAGEVEPEVVGQPGFELGRQEAHFRGHVAGPLLACLQVLEPVHHGREEDDGLRAERAVFGGPEAKRIDAGLPGQLGRAAAERDEGIGKAGPVHVDEGGAVLDPAGPLGDLGG